MSPKLRFILTLVLIPLTCLLCCQGCSKPEPNDSKTEPNDAKPRPNDSKPEPNDASLPKPDPTTMSLKEKAQILGIDYLSLIGARKVEKAHEALKLNQDLSKLKTSETLQRLLFISDHSQLLQRFALAEELSQHLVEQPAVLDSYSEIIGPWVIARYELPPQKPLKDTAGLRPLKRRNIAIVNTDERRVIELGDWDSVLELFWLIIDDMQGRTNPTQDHESSIFAVATGLTKGHNIYLPKTSLYPGPRLILNEDDTALIQYAFSPREDNAVATTLYTLTLTRKSISLSTENLVFN